METLETAPDTISCEIPEADEISEAEPDAEKVIIVDYLPVERLFASPLNPRKSFNSDALRELADSIAAHGIQQPVVVRPLRPQPGTGRRETDGSLAVTRYNITQGDLQIVMGERRWRAAILAGLTHIPCLLRQDIDDKLHTLLALEENTKRRDLTAIEEARGYKACTDQGYTQGEIGEKAGISQSRIANLIRLLDLPEDVQQMIEDGKLTAGHGIQLARYKDFPALCRHLAKLAVDAQWPVKLLEGGLVRQITRMAAQDQLLIALPAYNTAFDWKAVCVKNCPFKAFRGASDEQEGGYCLHPAHYKTLQAEAEAAKEAQTQGEAGRLREKAQAAADAARQAAAAAPNASARADAEKDAARAEKIVQSAENGLPDLTKLSYKEYIEIGATPPRGCTENCACRSRGRTWGSKVIECCTDPKRYSALKAAVEKDKTRDLKETLSAKLQRVQVAAAGDPTRIFTVLLASALMNATGDVKKHMAGVLAVEPTLKAGAGTAIREMLARKSWEVKPPMLWPLLVDLPAARQLSLIVDIRLRDEMDSALANRAENTPLMDWMIDGSPIADGGISTENRLYPCADCGTKDAGAFYVDGAGYEVDKHAMLGDWVCFGDMQKRQEAAQAEQVLCANCKEPLTTGAFESAIAAAAARQNPLRMNTGELLLPDGRAFCEQCGPMTGNDGDPLPDPEPDSDNEAPLCACGEPTCLGSCAAPEPWEYDRPDGLNSPSFAVGDAVEVRFNNEWYPGGVVGHGVPPSDSVYVLVTGYSAPTLFGPNAIRPAGKDSEAFA